MGMAIFFLFYGLAETINAIFVYRIKKEWFNLITTAFWGLTFILVAGVEILNLLELKNVIYFLFGISWWPMMFTPCAIKFLRKSKWTLLLRKVAFLIIGLVELFVIFY